MTMSPLGAATRRPDAQSLAASYNPESALLKARQQDFAATLNAAQGSPPGVKDASTQDKAREAAQDFVAIAFITPILKQMRSSERTPPPLGAGSAEKQLRTVADGQTARQIARATNFPLVDVLTRQLTGERAPVRPLRTVHATPEPKP